MNQRRRDSFPAGVASKLLTYVYRLIDPRNGETFSMGKGSGNRVFSHIRGEQDLEGDDLDNKIKRIRDAYPGLTNTVGGTGGDYGSMHAEEIIRRYSAEPAVFRHRALLISVNRSAAERSLYDATRYAWKISKAKARQAEVVLATTQGLIVAAFIAHDWLEATVADFPGRDGVPDRLGFVGEEAPDAMKRLYVAKRVPDEYRKRGAANPIKYTWGKGAAEQE